MRTLVVIMCFVGLSLFAAGCGGGGGGSASGGESTDLYVSYTYEGTDHEYTLGLNEADKLPHAEVVTGQISILACGDECSFSLAPLRRVRLYIDTDGAAPVGTVEASDMPSQEIVVTVSRKDADGGVVEGTFGNSTTVSNGRFRVRRDDGVHYF